MKKLALVTTAFVFAATLIMVSCATTVFAQTTDPATWPTCRLGAAPIAPGPAPAEARVFKTQGGPVIMSEAGSNGAVRLVRCRLGPDVEVYRGADGDLRDLPSNQPFWPVGWDATPPTPLTDAVKGLKGDPGPLGPEGPQGPQGFRGNKGDQGEPGRDGFCSSTKCRWTAIIVGGVVIGGTTWAIVRSGRDTPAGVPPGGKTGPAF